MVGGGLPQQDQGPQQSQQNRSNPFDSNTRSNVISSTAAAPFSSSSSSASSSSVAHAPVHASYSSGLGPPAFAPRSSSGFSSSSSSSSVSSASRAANGGSHTSGRWGGEVGAAGIDDEDYGWGVEEQNQQQSSFDHPPQGATAVGQPVELGTGTINAQLQPPFAAMFPSAGAVPAGSGTLVHARDIYKPFLVPTQLTNVMESTTRFRTSFELPSDTEDDATQSDKGQGGEGEDEHATQSNESEDDDGGQGDDSSASKWWASSAKASFVFCFFSNPFK
jgi:hypothetical protein